jgi:hypothetical protein
MSQTLRDAGLWIGDDVRQLSLTTAGERSSAE